MLIRINEPLLLFNHDQALDDPRDGLTLFGPLKNKPPFGISYGIIGTGCGVERFYRWTNNIAKPISAKGLSQKLWVPFPGFEAAFGVPFSKKAVSENIIDEKQLSEILKNTDSYQRVHDTVDLFVSPILDFYKKQDEGLDVWFLISPEEIFKTCRPKSKVAPNPGSGRINIRRRIETAKAIKMGQEFLFTGMNEFYKPYQFYNDFRKQLKARLIIEGVRDPVQIIRETTLAPNEFLNSQNERLRDLQPESQVAWNLLSTAFYKSGGKPWKLNGVRSGVCYLGMVYKKLDKEIDPRASCCAAQMFLDSGEGVVFKGAVGPWRSLEGKDYHLNFESAKEIVGRAIVAYKDVLHTQESPKEIFIHGRTYLNDEEWDGFLAGVSSETKIIGVRIRQSPIKLFRHGNYYLLRGMAYLENSKKAHLWTTGYIPRFQTVPSQGIPIPLSIEVIKGDADINVVVQDIYALTKLNYNSCQYGDSEPITLKFADNIGEILAAGPIEKDVAPMPFKFYI
jgi:hypothetical protein